ncbi:MAG: sortase [Candidatus Peribacteraceae bacterium]|jgi:LPXTG-site transpeptidase (sortase) family protein
MQRRIVTFITVFAVFLSQAAPVLAAQYADVRGTPYEDAFTYLTDRGVISGYPNGEGKPNAPLNRAEALKVLMGLRGKERVTWFTQNMVPLPLFRDVNQGEWYAPYVEAAFEANMVTGYPDKTFRPAQYLRVEEAVTLAVRAYDVMGSQDGAQLSTYIQNRDNEWFTPAINAAIEKNLIMHQGRLELGQVITRGRFFDIVFRLEKMTVDGAVAYQGSEPQVPVQAQQRAVGQQIAVATAVPTATVQQTSAGQSISVPQPAGTSYGSEKYFSISLPALGIDDLNVTHPIDPFTSDGILAPLQKGVGHLFGYPGSGGKVMIYGHSSGYPWDVSQYTKIFRQVNKLEQGDRIYVTYEGKLFTYEVNYKQTIQASSTEPFVDNGHGEELILYTCWPPDSITQRYLVHALPVNTVASVTR